MPLFQRNQEAGERLRAASEKRKAEARQASQTVFEGSDIGREYNLVIPMVAASVLVCVGGTSAVVVFEWLTNPTFQEMVREFASR